MSRLSTYNTFDLPQDSEIDLGTLWQGVRRNISHILLAATALALGVYLYFVFQSKVYETSVVLMPTSIGNIDFLNLDSILPKGTLEQALQGPVLIDKIIHTIQGEANITDGVKSKIVTKLKKQLQKQNLTMIEVQAGLKSQTIQGADRLYTVTAQGPTPQIAILLVDITTKTILDWTQSLMQGNLRRAERSLRAQLSEINEALTGQQLSALDRQTLMYTRANIQRSLAQVAIQAKEQTGLLEQVSSPLLPLEPIAPKPARNAALVGILVLFLGLCIAALRTVLDRTLRNEEDISVFGLSVLGIIPRVKRKYLKKVGKDVQATSFNEAIDFLQLNLLTKLGWQQGQSRSALFSYSGAVEGKSELLFQLAKALAQNRIRVLLIDAYWQRDAREFWSEFTKQPAIWHQLIGQEGARTLQEALQDPENVQVLRLEHSLDLLPVGSQESLSLFSHIDLGQLLKIWGEDYDLVLIDSPPLLRSADALALGKFVDRIFLIVQEGKTNGQELNQLLRYVQNVELSISGVILTESESLKKRISIFTAKKEAF